MTREERAIQILEQRACCRECVVSNCTCAECDEAFDMAIKVLNQYPVIDKIRAEIRKKIMFNSFNEGYVLYDDIIEVLNKYKTESGEEGE